MTPELSKAVQHLLALHSLEVTGTYPIWTAGGPAAATRLLADHGVTTFYQLGRIGCSHAERDLLTIDDKDSPELVLWAIQMVESGGVLNWDHAPYTEGWRRRWQQL